MTSLKKRKKRAVAVISTVVVAIVCIGYFVAYYVLRLKGVALDLFVGTVISVSTVAAVLIDRRFIQGMFHENKKFSRIIYRAKLIDEGKTVSDKEADGVKQKLLAFAQKNPGLEGEAYRYRGDVSFARGDTAGADQDYAQALEKLSHDTDDYFHVLNRRAACLLRQGKLEEAYKEFEHVAEINPFYSGGMAMMKEFGWGVERDLDESMRLYKLSAQNGNDNAVVNCAEVQWRSGHPVPEPDGYAAFLFKYHSQEGYQAGVPDLKASAEAGYAPSQYELGTLYMEGKLGKDQYAEAFRWLRMGADQNYPPAMHNLGFLVQMRCMDPVRGDVNEPVLKKPLMFRDEVRISCFHAGMELIHAAAEAGYAPSQHSVGCTYLRTQEYGEVQKWLKRAADQGYKKAQDDYETYKVYFNTNQGS